jgi:Fe-S-cluster containining protein
MSPIELARKIAQYRCKCGLCGMCCIYCTPISLDAEDIKRLENRGFVREEFVKVIDNETFIRGDLPCMFLLKDTLKCGIYEDRPNTCRKYPFMSNSHLEVDCFGINSSCAAMSNFWWDDMKDNPVFKAIMDLTSNEVFLTNATNTMDMLLKKKFGLSHI